MTAAVSEFQVAQKSPSLFGSFPPIKGRRSIFSLFACLCFGWRGTSGTGSDEFANLYDKGANHQSHDAVHARAVNKYVDRKVLRAYVV